MPYKQWDDVPASLQGIKPKISLEQANLIAGWADDLENAEGIESPWGIAISRFKETHVVRDGHWVKRTEKAAARFTSIDWDAAKVERDLDADAYCAVSLIDLNQADQDKIKTNCKLPIRATPDGLYNLNAMAAAAGALAGARTPMKAPPDKKQAAARRLARLYHEAEREPPPALLEVAGLNKELDELEKAASESRLNYLERLVEQLLPHLPPHWQERYKRSARGYAGGRASPRREEPISLELVGDLGGLGQEELKDWAQRLGEEIERRQVAEAEIKRDQSMEMDELIEKSWDAPILKVDPEKRICMAPVLVPWPFVDSQDDWLAREEVEDASRRFMAKGAMIREEHSQDRPGVRVTQNWLSPVPLTFELSDGEVTYPAGTWFMETFYPPEEEAAWQKVKEGELTGYSIGGFGKRRQEKREGGVHDLREYKPEDRVVVKADWNLPASSHIQ